MIYLIVPDVHEELGKLAAAMKHVHRAERVIFLGDWFDSFRQKQPAETAEWLKGALTNDSYIFLMGNHDNHYRWQSNWFKCSGYMEHKTYVINAIMGDEWHRLNIFHHDNGYLFSHAGIHPYFWDKYCDRSIDGLTQMERQAIDAANQGLGHWMLGAGAARGGRQSYGGINWLDWNHEFEPVEGLRQIVGHTYKAGAARRKGDNWCLDNGLNQVALINTDTHEMEVIALN